MSQQQSEISLVVSEKANSQKIAVSTSAALSAVLTSPWVMLYATVDCFIVQGASPTALADGTHQFIPANTMLRLRVTPGNKLSIVSAGTGSAYITQGA